MEHRAKGREGGRERETDRQTDSVSETQVDLRECVLYGTKGSETIDHTVAGYAISCCYAIVIWRGW